MQADSIQKQMSYTNKKDKIFNVRKVNYKQFDHEKYTKPTLSPGYQKEYQPFSTKPSKKITDQNSQLAIISSPLYKQLAKKYKSMKQQHLKFKHTQLEQLKSKQQQLVKCKAQKQRIQNQRIKLIHKRDQLRLQIQEIRQKNQMLRTEQYHRQQEYRIMNMEYLRNMILGMRYQNGMEIDLDNMSYEELLQLQEKMGNVNKGLSQEQIHKLTKKVYKKQQTDQLCPICYENAQQGDELIVLPCEHTYHSKCIQEWLIKEKVCPMCKQEIINKISSSKNLKLLQNQQVENQQQQQKIQQ